MTKIVCLYYLNDAENAQIAFRKSILSSNAIKNPLIYLNYSIFCLECLKDVEETNQYLNNFYNLCDSMNVPSEVCYRRMDTWTTIQCQKILKSFFCSTFRLLKRSYLNYLLQCFYLKQEQWTVRLEKPGYQRWRKIVMMKKNGQIMKMKQATTAMPVIWSDWASSRLLIKGIKAYTSAEFTIRSPSMLKISLWEIKTVFLMHFYVRRRALKRDLQGFVLFTFNTSLCSFGARNKFVKSFHSFGFF